MGRRYQGRGLAATDRALFAYLDGLKAPRDRVPRRDDARCRARHAADDRARVT